jgi:hypothetical protein
MKKILGLFNIKKWIDGVVFQKVAAKGAKYAVAAVLALLASDKVAPAIAKAKPVLDSMGINPEQVAVVGVTALVGAILNWLKNGPLKAE